LPNIKFVAADGGETFIDVKVGESLMVAAIRHKLKGIDGDCGGLAACSTCHVYIADEWWDSCGEVDELEADMLPFAIDQQKNSRLCCQIIVDERHEGMTVNLPKRQY